jgi:uncharacterized protein YbjT (DUF2867 family)
MPDDHDPAHPILVTGGSGILGRLVVDRLLELGRSVRVLSRGRHPREADQRIDHVTADLSTGAGVDVAMTGIREVVHLAGSAKGDEVKAAHLVDAVPRTGIRHIVFISVVGADRVPMAGRIDQAMFGYFGSKRGAELAIAGSGLPWTILRATQFDDLALATVRAMARWPVIPVPAGFRFQPVDPRDVADRLVELTLAGPAGLVPDMGGPRVYGMDELVRSYLEAAGRRRPIISVPTPGAAARAIRAGANLTPDHAVGRRTWEAFLAERVGTHGRPVPRTTSRPASPDIR